MPRARLFAGGLLGGERPCVEGFTGPASCVNKKIAHSFAGFWCEGLSLRSPEEVPAGRLNVVRNTKRLLGCETGVVGYGRGLLDEELIVLAFQQAAGDEHSSVVGAGALLVGWAGGGGGSPRYGDHNGGVAFPPGTRRPWGPICRIITNKECAKACGVSFFEALPYS